MIRFDGALPSEFATQLSRQIALLLLRSGKEDGIAFHLPTTGQPDRAHLTIGVMDHCNGRVMQRDLLRREQRSVRVRNLRSARSARHDVLGPCLQ
jgi:hypothetical protein